MAIINLVLAVGLAVDYSCHVAHSFVQMPATPGLSPRAQRQERTDRAVEEMGVAVVHGAVSTFLAVPTSPSLPQVTFLCKTNHKSANHRYLG